MFNGKIHYKWPCSIAMLVYQRVTIITYHNQRLLGTTTPGLLFSSSKSSHEDPQASHHNPGQALVAMCLCTVPRNTKPSQKKNINGWYKKSPNGRFLVGFPMLQWLQPNVVSAVMSVAHAVCSKNQLGPPQQIKTEDYQALRYTRLVRDPTILIVYQFTTLPMFAYIPVWL